MATTDAVAACNCCGGTSWTPCFSENGHTLGQCGDCDLLYIDPMPTRATRMTEMESGHFGGDLSKKVLDGTKQTAAEAAKHQIFTNYLQHIERHVSEGRWLEIGCGAGYFMGVAERAGYAVEGIELTPARRKIAESTGATVHGRPVEDLGFPAHSFDVITLIDVFSHLTNPRETLTELRRIIRPGGVILLATGEILSPPHKGDVFSWNLGDHLFFLGTRTIARYADTVGLREVEHHRTWLPSDIYTKDRLAIRGNSGLRNVVKTAVVRTPGALALLRAWMLKKHKNNSAHSGVILLTAP